MSQQDLKYVIGYSSVSHMGYVLMGIATLDRIGVGGAVLQMFSHGIMTALMFLLVGAIYDRTHIRDINVLNGLSNRMRVTSFFFAIAGLASMGLPGLSGFIAEFMVFTGAFRTYLPLAVLAVVGAALTAVYILRLLARTFLGESDARWQDLTDSSPVEQAVGGAFVLILIFVGVWPEPLMRVINVGVAVLPEYKSAVPGLTANLELLTPEFALAGLLYCPYRRPAASRRQERAIGVAVHRRPGRPDYSVGGHALG